ncbi:MAG: cytochrome ubiquinol oxidase subunit I [Rhodospirillales bacterium 20-60-12]|nr:MAG: cytochrome ubiquinol oxidase subunit I [Rhodospirillales bacterium 20-60-12]HQT66976.1 cytochrome ubiquinol oxidase subunit I [Acetobacteraceae bacterium]
MTPIVISPLAIELARAQFGFTIAFHIMFPAFSIGLASYLAVLEGAWIFTQKSIYLDAFKYWLKIFAVVFAIGVVSGLVMAYEIGTNWSGYSNSVGPILGPLLAWETLTAFFLEAGFLGIMLFGLERVGKTLHFAATLAVAIGTIISASWILAANSWMQTPAGAVMGADGKFVPQNWFEIIFNPSFPYRWVHMVIAAYLATALTVGAASAWQLLHNNKNKVSRLTFSMALWMIALVIPVQIMAGDTQGDNTLAYQPAKLAAIEGDFHTGVQPLNLFGWPDRKTGELLYPIAIPHLGSLILTHKWNGVVQGLDAFPKKNWPVLDVTFWSFRIMVGLGFAMLGYGLLSFYLRARKQFYESRWFQWLAVAMGPTGFIAIVMGWTTTETGRQPWSVYGLLRTSQSVSPLTLSEVAASFAIIIVLYGIVFGSGLRYLLKLMATEPHIGETGPSPDLPLRTHGPQGLYTEPGSPVAAE